MLCDNGYITFNEESKLILSKIQQLPSVELLCILFRYEDGKLIRNIIPEHLVDFVGFTIRGLRRWNSTMSGKEAGHEFTTSGGTKSKQVRINNISYYVHRVIFKLVYGEEPNLIDHINGDPTDNRIENLRSVTNQENSKNSKRFNTNTSGVVGVSWSKVMLAWEAYIWHNSKKINLSYYPSIEEAAIIRKDAERQYSYHENHGR